MHKSRIRHLLETPSRLLEAQSFFKAGKVSPEVEAANIQANAMRDGANTQANATRTAAKIGAGVAAGIAAVGALYTISRDKTTDKDLEKTTQALSELTKESDLLKARIVKQGAIIKEQQKVIAQQQRIIQQRDANPIRCSIM